MFNIGGERGFLFYPGQPVYCRKCCVYGDTSGDCDKGVKCRFCGTEDHSSKECKQKKVCDICKMAGHLARQCPEYSSTKRFSELNKMIARNLAKEAQRRSDYLARRQGSRARPANVGQPAAFSEPETNDAAPTAQSEAVNSEAGAATSARADAVSLEVAAGEDVGVEAERDGSPTSQLGVGVEEGQGARPL